MFLAIFRCFYVCEKFPKSGLRNYCRRYFSLSQYRLDNLFTRFALGEIQAYIFWPIIIYGLYDLIFDEFKSRMYLNRIAGMLLTHTVSTALALGLCVLYVLIFIKRLIKNPRKIIKLGITALIVVAVTSFYWIPLLEFMSSCDLTVAHPRNAASQFVGKFLNLFKDIPLIYADAGLGIVIFLLCLPRIALCKKSPIYKSLIFPIRIRSVLSFLLPLIHL